VGQFSIAAAIFLFSFSLTALHLCSGSEISLLRGTCCSEEAAAGNRIVGINMYGQPWRRLVVSKYFLDVCTWLKWLTFGLRVVNEQ